MSVKKATPVEKAAKQNGYAFVAASNDADLPKEVAIARPVAVRMLLDGDVETGIPEGVEQILGDASNVPGGSERWSDYCLHISAAYALGIAIGQLTHPHLFKTGGAR